VSVAVADAGAATAPTRDLRARLGWFLLVRLLLVSAFFASAALVYIGERTDTGLDTHLGLIVVGYGVTAVSGLLLSRVQRIVLYTAVQIGVDLVLVSSVIVLTGSLETPLPVLYNMIILNAALLRLGRGITLTAVAAALAYTAVIAIVTTLTGHGHPLDHVFIHVTNVLSFFAIGTLARYLTTQLNAAERLLDQQQHELRRIEDLHRLVANTVDHGLVVTDGSGRITSTNPSAVEIFGIDLATALGASLSSLLPDAVALPGDAEAVEFAIGEASARRVLQMKAATVTDAYQHAVARVYVVHDVTTVREMESRLREHEAIEAYASSVQPLGDAAVTTFEGLVGESDVMRRLFAMIEKIAPTDSTVLITGESGTGKELVARAVHARSPRVRREFVAVNCGAVPETLIESEFFGHVRGAFTGAIADRPGLFRQASGGTIFLYEIGELSPSLQVRLLRVLQDRQIVPVGGTTAIAADVRVIAATNRDLEKLVATGQFREDLYYRLNVIRLETPSLRERPEDIPILLLHLLRNSSARHGKAIAKLSPRTMRTLATYAYPGNIRELENIVDHAVTLCDGDLLTEHDLPAHILAHEERASAPPRPDPEPAASPLFTEGRSLDDQLETYEKDMLLAALDRAGGVRKRAAELLGIKYRSLRHRLAKYGLMVGDDEELDGSLSN